MRQITSSFVPAALACAVLAATSCTKAADQSAAPAAPAPEQTLFNEPLSPAPDASPAAKDPATVVVTVNSKEITQGILDAQVEQMMLGLRSRVPPERLDQMRMQLEQQALDNLISKQLIDEKLASENISVTEEEYTNELAVLTARLPPGATLDVLLAQAGKTAEEFREEFTTGLKFRKLIEAQSGGSVEATEAEALAFYEENKKEFEKAESVEASHILIKVEPSDDDAAKAEKRAKLESIKTEIAGGADFAAMARENSDCPSKEKGGSLGSFTRGTMVPEFSDAAFTQPVGEVGNIVETQFGFHIIRVDSKADASTAGFDEVKEKLIKYLTSQKEQKVAMEFVEGLKKSATITYPGQ